LHLRCDDHEDDQQHQHHVHQRRDVDVGRHPYGAPRSDDSVAGHADSAAVCELGKPPPPLPAVRSGRAPPSVGAGAMPVTSRSAHVSMRSSSSPAALLSSISSFTTCPFRKLNARTDGIATARPKAVSMSASLIPADTAARPPEPV